VRWSSALYGVEVSPRRTHDLAALVAFLPWEEANGIVRTLAAFRIAIA